MTKDKLVGGHGDHGYEAGAILSEAAQLSKIYQDFLVGGFFSLRPNISKPVSCEGDVFSQNGLVFRRVGRKTSSSCRMRNKATTLSPKQQSLRDPGVSTTLRQGKLDDVLPSDAALVAGFSSHMRESCTFFGWSQS